MSSFISRLLVSAIGLPLVLGLLWLDGWWLFGLAVVAAVVAVHEFVTMARPLRPLAPAIYIGVVLALVSAHRGGAAWMLGGLLATFLFAFVLNAFSKTRAPSTVAIGATILGAMWIGAGRGTLVLLLQEHDKARLLQLTGRVAVCATDTF